MSRNAVGLAPFLQNVRQTFSWRKPMLNWELAKLLMRKLTGERFIRGIDIALTYDCNLRCAHCNVERLRDPNREILSETELADCIRQARDLGAVNFTFTGGEPLLFKSRLETAVRAADPRRTLLHIQSNALLMDEATVAWMARIGIDTVSLSFDAFHENESVDELLARRREQIATLRRHGIRTMGVAVAAHTSIYTEPFRRILEFAQREKVPITLNLAVPLGRWLGNEEVLLTEDDSRHVRQLAEESPYVRLDFNMNIFNYGCPAFTERFHVNAYGDVQPCTFAQIAFGNVREESLKVIWRRGLENSVFRTFAPYCPPAEDKEFIARYSRVMATEGEHPVPRARLFSDDGSWRGKDVI
jgi:MoaA/NifB/PqqE/SkfB family radical SAM enzyme